MDLASSRSAASVERRPRARERSRRRPPRRRGARGDGDYVQLTGNQVGVLLAALPAHRGSRRRSRAHGRRRHRARRRMLGVHRAQLGARLRETLTGFKWIANRAMDSSARQGPVRVRLRGGARLHGRPDSCATRTACQRGGALRRARRLESRARAQRARRTSTTSIAASALFVTEQVSLHARGGSKASPRSARAMAGFRAASRRTTSAGARVRAASRTLARGEGGLPPSDVLVFKLDGGRRVIMRPSGTEPKLKCYLDHREEMAAGEPMAAAESRAASVLAEVRATRSLRGSRVRERVRLAAPRPWSHPRSRPVGSSSDTSSPRCCGT